MTDWEASGPDGFGDFHISSKGEQLAKCVVIQNGFRSAEETQAIALQVLKAVNNHAKLVEALDIVRKMIAGEIIEAAVIDTQTMEGLGSMIDRVLAPLISPRHT